MKLFKSLWSGLFPKKPLGEIKQIREILTHSGRYFNFDEPEKSYIDIKTIAHALSNICRFTGHIENFYCVTPDTKVLTYDFRWVDAGSITTGDMLWGFDEENQGHRDLRKWRPSQATVYGRVERDLYEIQMEDGTKIRCSSEHPFLASAKAAGNQQWITAKELFEHMTLNINSRYRSAGSQPMRYLPKFVEPWKEEQSWKSGWLAGMFDGEGSVSSKQSRGAILTIAQNPGELLENIKQYLSGYGYLFTESKSGEEHSKCKQLYIRGGLSEQLHLLGSIRPARLLKTMQNRLEGREFTRAGDLVPIKKITYIGKGEVVAMETSTHTYITEGFGSHNSVAQHSVLVSYLVPPEHAMEGLIHDASEAYIGDVATPLKAMLSDYKTIEHRVEAAVLGHFGLPVIMHPSVKQADLKALATEKRDLMPDAIDGLPWDCIEGIEPHPEKIIPLSPEDAKNLFLARYYELKMLKESSKATNAKERKLNVLTSTNH